MRLEYEPSSEALHDSAALEHADLHDRDAMRTMLVLIRNKRASLPVLPSHVQPLQSGVEAARSAALEHAVELRGAHLKVGIEG